MTKNRLFREPGVRSRSDNFSHAGMAPWGVFGVRAAPKSMCTLGQKSHFGTIFQAQFFFKVDVRHHPNIIGDDLRSKEYVPMGSYLRGKSCPTSLRYLLLSESDFE